MQPFDQAALLGMLLAFYPVVSVANLRTARQERPDYFGGGTLGGTSGEKLFLPDGRIFDLIFAVEDPTRRRWQVIDVTAGGDEPNPFPLEPGPLEPLDADLFPEPTPQPLFEALVGDGIRELWDAEGVAGDAETRFAEASSSEDFEASYDNDVEPARGRLEEQIASHDALDVGGQRAEADGIGASINAEREKVVPPEDEPEDAPEIRIREQPDEDDRRDRWEEL